MFPVVARLAFDTPGGGWHPWPGKEARRPGPAAGEAAAGLDYLLADFVPIAVLFVVAASFAAACILVGYLLGPKRPTREKSLPYECGIDPVGTARERFPVRFYVIAMLFILFDVEVVFFMPWAAVFRVLGPFGLVEMGLFVVVLLVGYVYLWRTGALEWQ